MAHLFLRGEAGEGRATGGAVPGIGERALAVRDAGLPIKVDAAALAEGGDDRGELRMDAGTVIALVVVFEDQLPVGLELVADALRSHEIGERVVREAA